MTTTDIHSQNLKRMDECRAFARSIGFMDAGPCPGSLSHTTSLAMLEVTDPEVSWRLSLRKRCVSPLESFVIETGSVDLSNLTVEQFKMVLSAVVLSTCV